MCHECRPLGGPSGVSVAGALPAIDLTDFSLHAPTVAALALSCGGPMPCGLTCGQRS
jgi:hypothetical protein